MRISHKYKFICFANPKTGLESIRKILDQYSDIIAPVYLERTKENPFYSHITCAEARDIFESKGWDYSTYTKFVFVRNPWARLVSLYEMIYGRRPWRRRSPFSVWLLSTRPNGVGGGGRDFERWRRCGT